jgi:hypothetical protein
VELLHAHVPNTLYNISVGTNIIQASNNTTTSGGTMVSFSIPPGYYSAGGLASELTSALNTTTGISVQFLQNEGKYLFKRSATTGSFDIQIMTQELSRCLGMAETTVLSSQNIPDETDTELPLYSAHTVYRNNEFVKSTTIADLHTHEGLFLDIEEFRTNDHVDALKWSGNTYSGNNIGRTFGMIPLDVNSGDIKTFKKTSDFDFAVDFHEPIRSIDRLRIRWLTKDGLPAEFNGANSNSFMLRFFVCN